MTSDNKIIANNTFFQLLARAVTILVSLLIIPFLTRYLGPDLYGEYSLVLVLNTFLMSISDFGIQTIAVRDAAQHPERVGLYAVQATILRTCAAIFLALVSSVALFFTGYSDTVKFGFLLLATSVVIQALQSGFLLLLQLKLKIYLISIADVLSRVVSALLTIAVIMLSANFALSRSDGLDLILAGPLLGALAALILLAVVTKNIYRFNLKFNYTVSKSIILNALPLGVVAIFSMIHYRIDTILLSILKDSYDVGIYSLAYRFLDLTLTFPSMLMVSIFPLLSLNSTNFDKFKSIYQKSFDILGLIAIPVALGTFLLAPQIVIIFGGEGFTPAILPLRILSFALIFSYLNSIFYFTVVLKNKQKSILLFSILGVSINIILNLILIPNYTYNGSAVATLISEIIGMIMMLILSYRLYGYSVRLNKIIKSLGAGLVMLAILWPIQNLNIFIVSILGATIYFATAIIFKAVDLQTIKEVLHRDKS